MSLEYTLFNSDMKKDYTILVPSMLPIHFRLLTPVFAKSGYKLEVLTNEGEQVREEGLAHVHNDTCYPALLVIGQMIDALKSGKYDMDHVACAITQTAGGCRASNYLSLLRKALAMEGWQHIPCLSANANGLEKGSSVEFTMPLILRILYGALYGDALMWLGNQVKPYELEKGATDKAVNQFIDELIPMFEKEYPNVMIEGVYDSSGKLQLQIEKGLDADVFFSAATTQMSVLKDEALVDADSILNVLENKLVLIKGKDSTTTVTGFDNIRDASIIAIGDPEVVPAGSYAKEALTNLGVWDFIQNRLSLAGNVMEVLSQVETQNAEIGLVYATDAASSDKVEVVAECDNSLLVTPVLYPIGRVSTTKHKDEANSLIEFLKSDKALKVFKKYGFKKGE